MKILMAGDKRKFFVDGINAKNAFFSANERSKGEEKGKEEEGKGERRKGSWM